MNRSDSGATDRQEAAAGRWWKGFVLAGWLMLGLAGCQSAPKPDYTPQHALFFLETAGASSVPVKLPVSGLELSVSLRPVITEYDIVKVSVASSELGPCLEFQFSAAALRDVYRLTASQNGRRLVLIVNGVALGAHRIARPVTDGVLRVYVEKPDAEIISLARNLQLTSASLQPEMARK